MPRTYKPKSDLSKLKYSPTQNPLYPGGNEIKTKRRMVRATRGQELIDTSTGEIGAISAIYQTEYKDDEEFVKVFAQGINAAYELTKTAQRVFQLVLEQYQRTPMTGGYADSIELFWFGEGIEGRDVGMSQYTFQRGLRELLDKHFLAPKTPSSFWANPALFFKGDRVVFVKEYRRKSSEQHPNSLQLAS